MIPPICWENEIGSIPAFSVVELAEEGGGEPEGGFFLDMLENLPHKLVKIKRVAPIFPLPSPVLCSTIGKIF